jgi:hypothetical protein
MINQYSQSVLKRYELLQILTKVFVGNDAG